MIGTVRTVTADILSEAESVLAADIPYVGGDTFYTDELSDAGAFTLALNEAGTGAVASAVVNNLVRFYVDGTADRTCLIEKAEIVPVARTRGERIRSLTGRDWVALFDDAPVDPPLGVDSEPVAHTVRFDWTHPQLDRSGWINPTYIGSLFTADRDQFGAAVPAAPLAKSGIHPDGWPDTFTGWIWASAADGGGSHPAPQTVYFHLDLTLQARPFIPIFTADDMGELAFDGAVIDSGVDPPAVQWTRATASGIPMVSAGTHHLCVKATNTVYDTDWDSRGNPGCIALVAYQPGGPAGSGFPLTMRLEYNNVVARTGVNVSSSDPVIGGGWKCLQTSTPPGFTPGHAFRLLFDQAQASGHLSGWTLGFSDTLDSNGQAWTTSDELTASTDESLLDVMIAWFDLGKWEFAARAGSKVLDAWRFGRRGDFYTAPGSPPAWDADHVDNVTVEQSR